MSKKKIIFVSSKLVYMQEIIWVVFFIGS